MARGLYPRQRPRPTLSQAEVTLWEHLKAALPPGWTAWHSLRIQSPAGIDGEGDFLFLIPELGLLALEVKGGRISVRDGIWYQNGRPLHTSPRAQAHAFIRKLMGRIEQRGLTAPAFGVATCFPDTPFKSPPTQDDLVGRVLGAHDLPHLAQVLPAVARRALPRHATPITNPDAYADLLHRMWCETWTPEVHLGHRLAEDADRRIQLDAAQLQILTAFQENPRVLVAGSAGSGKSILAREAAIRRATPDARALLLCFTDALARWLDHTTPDTVEVWPIRRLARHLVKSAGLPLPPESDAEGWDNLPWQAATDGLRHHVAPWSAVIIDEAQDFALGDWALVEALATRPTPLWAFHDPAQRFWDDRDLDRDLFPTTLTLPNTYRTPPELMRLANTFAPTHTNATHDKDALLEEREAARAAAIKAGRLSVVAAPTEDAVHKKIETELDKLLGQGLTPADIAVLSLRGRSAEGSITLKKNLGRHTLVPADDPTMQDHIVADTFLRFKGLERPAILITDLRLLEDQSDVRMHLALTRALTTCHIVAPKPLLQKLGDAPPT